MNIIKLIKDAIFNASFSNKYKDEVLNHQEVLDDHLYRYSKRIMYQQKYQLMQSHFMDTTEMGICKDHVLDKDLVISLTTFGRRINTVWATIESLMCQTVKPNRITLWISEKDYKDCPLPITLERQKERGLEIHFIEDVRSFTKLVPALMKYPDCNIITVDDDYIYPIDFIERFVNAAKSNPNTICCLEARLMKRNEDNSFAYFNSFPRVYQMPEDNTNMRDYMPEGFAGVLYPPNSLHEDVTRKDLFLSLCPTNDDLWFKIMSLLKKTPIYIIQNYMELFTYISSNLEVQEEGLYHTNESGAFDEQLKKVLDYYNLK